MTDSKPFELEKHHSWQSSSKINEICKVIFDKLGLNYIDYARFYPGNECSIIYTDPEYVKNFLSNEAYDEPPSNLLTPGLHLWTEYIDPSYLEVAAVKFNHAHGITIVNEFNDYVEVFNLATRLDNNKILSLYLNQQTILQQLVDYFKSEAKKVIETSGENRLIIPAKKIEVIDKSYALDDNYLKEISTLLRKSNSFTIKVNNVSIGLSQRELQCVYLFAQGLSSKEIARKLLISHRTVEGYLDGVRHKTYTKSRLELMSRLDRKELEALASNGLMEDVQCLK